ncbi:LADA_0D04984g1_1 [Lachancea dasiensis]|uniref:LADA_0D04984g1_1 n=1 Tax=Lachancea dasiensis TaxID=1072105 RepID=A0A1G4J593_9SACH|nr:LADA_0D04984g1_1 [Lachancea dasiensis]
MDRSRLVADATTLLPPLSGLSPAQVVAKYLEARPLARKILQDPPDFDNEFWRATARPAPVRAGELGGCALRVFDNLSRVHGEGPVYVFIHGLGGNATQFEPLVRVLDALNEGFVALDLPGFGKSAEAPRYAMSAVAAAVGHTVAQLVGEGHPLVVVGHSLGCHVALHFVAQFGGRYAVRDAVFLAPPAPELPQLRTAMARAGLFVAGRWPVLLDWYRWYFDQHRGLDSSGIQRFFHRGDPYRKLWQFHHNVQIKSRSVVEYLRGWERVEWEHEHIRSLASVVVMCGDADPVTPLATARSFYAMLSGVPSRRFVVVERCSHNLCLDQPAQVTLRFLEAVVDRHG